jgi:hypothetical protein
MAAPEKTIAAKTKTVTLESSTYFFRFGLAKSPTISVILIDPKVNDGIPMISMSCEDRVGNGEKNHKDGGCFTSSLP